MPVSLVQFAWMQVEKYPFCGFTSSDILFPNCDETYDDTFSLFPYLPFSKSTLRPVPAPCENFYQLSSKKIGEITGKVAPVKISQERKMRKRGDDGQRRR